VIRKVGLYFNLLMIAGYAVMGFFLIFADKLDLLDQPQQKWLGGILVSYAIYRGYRSFRSSKKEQEPLDEN
jgi:hypothetical protein